MALYWRLKSVPELKELPSDVHADAYRAAWRAARTDGALRWVHLSRHGADIVILAVVFWFLFPPLARIDSVAVQALIIGSLFGTIPSWTPWLWRSYTIRAVRPYIREYLTAGT